jgi:hypothetical protein
MSKVIAIGALGGSGTRAVAQVLIESGIYMGDDLNEPNDNLIFTRLFKNPPFYRNASRNSLNARLGVFKEYMERNHLSLKNAAILIKSTIDNPIFQKNRKLYSNVLKKISNRTMKREIWGWKAPNTHIYINEIYNYFESLKYIHVIRHGLDMAFSNNKQQLLSWGYKYDIHLNGDETEDEMSYKQLDYWVKSTKESIIKGKKLGDDFLLINHSLFCQQPKEQVDRMLSFVGCDISEEVLRNLYKIPKITSSQGRFKDFDLSIFDKNQIDFVKELGFEV